MKVYDLLDLRDNQLKGVVAEIRTTVPNTTPDGKFYYDATAGAIVWTHNNIVINPLDRSHHTGAIAVDDVQGLAAGNGLALDHGTFTIKLGVGSGLVATTNGLAINPSAVVRRFAASIPAGSATSYPIVHNLGSRDVMVQVYQVAAPYGTVEVDVNRTDVNTVTIVFAAGPTEDYRVLVG